MSSRYNFEAQSAKDVVVRHSRAEPKSYIDEEQQPNPWKQEVSSVPNKEPKLPSRVLNICLEGSQATAVTADSVSWALAYPTIGLLKKGALMYVNTVVSNAASAGEYAISGIACETLGDSLSGFYELTAATILTPVGNAPLCVSIKDPSCFLTGVLTLRRLASGAQSFASQGSAPRLYLTLVEPGANFP